jgi:hypothetical protein
MGTRPAPARTRRRGSVHTGGRPESLRRQGERAHSLSMSTAGRSYIYGQDRELEQARLAGLSAQFDPVTIRHLASIGVEAGWHCLEVGAGAGSIARWLAATVGGTGRVVATDLDTQFSTSANPTSRFSMFLSLSHRSVGELVGYEKPMRILIVIGQRAVAQRVVAP